MNSFKTITLLFLQLKAGVWFAFLAVNQRFSPYLLDFGRAALCQRFCSLFSWTEFQGAARGRTGSPFGNDTVSMGTFDTLKRPCLRLRTARPHGEEPVGVAQASGVERCSRHVPLGGSPKQDPGHAGETFPRQTWKGLDVLPGELEVGYRLMFWLLYSKYFKFLHK